MEVNTRIFGTIDIGEDKLIHFVNGIVGFPELTKFALIHDNEKEGGIQWLQSMQEPQFAIPVINPLDVIADYNLQGILANLKQIKKAINSFFINIF